MNHRSHERPHEYSVFRLSIHRFFCYLISIVSANLDPSATSTQTDGSSSRVDLLEQLKAHLDPSLFAAVSGKFNSYEFQLQNAQLKVQVLEERLRLARIAKYGPGSEKLSNLQLELLEHEPGVSDGDTERHCLRQGALSEKVLAERLDFILLHFDIGFPGITVPRMDRSFEEYAAAEVGKLRNIKFGVLSRGEDLHITTVLNRRLLEEPIPQWRWSTERREQCMNPALSVTIEGFLAIAAKHIVLHLLGSLGHLLAGKAHRMEIACTEERIE